MTNEKAQDELPLGQNETVAAQPATLDKRLVVAVIIGVAFLLWAAWVTKAVVDAPANERFKSVELQPLIQEYVQAQSRSTNSESVITSETETFMSVLEEELKKAGANGDTVIVSEAVLSKNVPDITSDIRAAIYKRVNLPKAIPLQQREAQLPTNLPAGMLGNVDGQ